ncbi:hypothetical protein F2Q68_00009099 [Brassica cretica]|uniref:Uncharacterized protein n=1 Tax=Brassica cretica TaxID=69181 RepID=A0A8S9KRR1_BRACR|nr:hypothetical protein F2Q68_00009099 [Brassica cretica]
MWYSDTSFCSLLDTRSSSSSMWLQEILKLFDVIDRILVRKTLEGVLTYQIIPLSAQVKVIHLSNNNHIRDHSTLNFNQLSCAVASATFFVSYHPILVNFKY